MKHSRIASFTVIAAVYLLACAVGLGVYLSLPFHFAVKLLLADIAATILVFVFSVLLRNASVYDPYWSVQPPVIVTAFAIGYGVNAMGVILLVAVWFWAIRLTTNWAYTFGDLTHQDWRYTMLHDTTGVFYPVINLIGIHLVPTLVVYGCVLPVAYAIVTGVHMTPVGVIFCVLAILAATMQGIADIQMHKFRKNKTGTFIRLGLWRYSRHPNYLGEILMWWCIACAVVLSSHMWWLFIGALCNTLLFLCVSVPLAEKRQSRKEGWSTYKRETRMLLPIYKRQS